VLFQKKKAKNKASQKPPKNQKRKAKALINELIN
jgi:hypothetical protein